MRQKIVAGNWKMNKTLEEANILASEVKGMVADEVKGNVKVILCTPFPYLIPINNLLGNDASYFGGCTKLQRTRIRSLYR